MKKPKHASSVISIGSSGSLLLHDEFTDTNGTLLPAHAIAPYNVLKTAWVKENTYNIEINGANKATFIEGAGTATKDNDHSIDLSLTGVTVECDLQINDQVETVNHSVVIRYVDNTHSIAAQVQSVGGLVYGIQLKWQDGTDSSATYIAHTFSENDDSLPPYDVDGIADENTMRVVDDGETISITMRGKTISWDTPLHNTATKIAIRTDNENGQTWDNLKVWKT